MSILPAQTIEHLCTEKMMVQPFKKRTLNEGFTGGLSPSGFDIHIDQDVVLFPVTLKNLALKACGFYRPSFMLASSIECFRIPTDIMAFVTDKSTWARLGLALQNTCLEPNWSGFLTLELSNHGEEIITIKRGQPIAQVVFHYLHAATHMPYVGKYNLQRRGVQQAILESNLMDPDTWETNNIYKTAEYHRSGVNTKTP